MYIAVYLSFLITSWTVMQLSMNEEYQANLSILSPILYQLSAFCITALDVPKKNRLFWKDTWFLKNIIQVFKVLHIFKLQVNYNS